MITSRFYYKNVLRRAEAGLGDGTKYATATGATSDQSAKTFVLAGLSIIADLGADANDKFNGYVLYFPASGNVYHIVDWVASSDTATVYETPDTDDTGACEIRLTLYEDDSDVAYPVCLAVDGRRETKWKANAADIVIYVPALLPNFVADGGFEQQSAGNPGDDWYSGSGDWQIVDSVGSGMRGVRYVEYTKGATNAVLRQGLTGTFEKGKTYRIVMLVKALTAPPAANDILRVYLLDKNVDTDLLLDADWEDGGHWDPEITTSETWVTSDFVPDQTTDRVRIWLTGRGSSGTWGGCTGFDVDELYIWEKISVDRLMVFDHNWDAGVWVSGDASSIIVQGWYLNPSRTQTTSADRENGLDGWTQQGSEPILKTVTLSADYPIYRIRLNAKSWLTYEAGEIFLGPAMAFSKQMDFPFDPDAEEAVGVMNETQGGVRRFHKDFHRGGPYEIVLTKVNSSFYSSLRDWWEEVGRDHFPFFFCFDETSAPDKIKLVRSESNWLFAYDPVLRGGRITLREEL
jgi:hypothetical protein